MEQIALHESQVKILIANSSAGPATPSSSQPALDATLAPSHDREERDDGGTDDDDEDDENEDQFIELEEDLANVIADVHDLGTSFCSSFRVTVLITGEQDISLISTTLDSLKSSR